jgi:hypothetical protein
MPVFFLAEIVTSAARSHLPGSQRSGRRALPILNPEEKRTMMEEPVPPCFVCRDIARFPLFVP